jgi:hypothetical protein
VVFIGAQLVIRMARANRNGGYRRRGHDTARLSGENAKHL